MTKEGKVKIRLKGLEGGPMRLRVLPKFEADFDVRGVAEVPSFVAEKLLGPGYKGSGFELFEEPKVVVEKPVEKTVGPGPVAAKKIPAPKAKGQTEEEKEFAKSIVG